MDIKLITELNTDEKIWWETTIKSFRDKIIKDPSHYAKSSIETHGYNAETLKDDIETALEKIRETAWQLYLLDEAIFHKEIISHLIKTRNLPRSILLETLEENILNEDLIKLSKEELISKIAQVVGDTAGRIMPYIYALSLSTTQSRRSRAGSEFEKIVENFFKLLKYPFDNQSSVANGSYRTHNLGKKVDMIVPSLKDYLDNRPKCAVITLKTTLRERWQEVAEELSRTNVPHIYLLTVDREVTKEKINVIKQYNITLVLYKKDKTEKFSELSNVQDYETFFFKEMPHIINYWKEN